MDGDYYEAMIDKGQWGEFGQDTGLHIYSLREVSWDFNYHSESGPRFNVSSERRGFESIVSPSLHWGVRTHTDWSQQGAGLTNTSSYSNLVFPGGLPSSY